MHWFFALGLGALVAGCSGTQESTTTAVELPAECDAFVSALERCLASSTNAADTAPHARALQSRAALVEQARRVDFASLKTTCRENRQRILSACASAGTSQ